jgi:hypothetical protein
MWLLIIGYCKTQRLIFQSFTVFNETGDNRIIDLRLSKVLGIKLSIFDKYYEFVIK